ncbi:MAG: hypothetical protein AAF439_07690 [Pseudomonadota bacterium]
MLFGSAALAATLTVLPIPANAEPDAPLSGAEIAELMPCIYFDYAGFWQEFEPGGVSHIVLRNSLRIPAHWRTEGPQLCLRDSFQQSVEKCYRVRKDVRAGLIRGLFLTDRFGEEHYQKASER